MQFKHVLLALWGGVALLTWYRSARPSSSLDTVYTIIFAGVFVLSLVYLGRRARGRVPKD